MMLPVELMSIVGSSTPSTKHDGLENVVKNNASSRMPAADGAALKNSNKDMINKIYLSYEQEGSGDPVAQFAADLKAVLSANGVTFTPDQAMQPPIAELSAPLQEGQTVGLAWSVDEFLQWAEAPMGSGSNLPPGDQSLPAELSQWLATLVAPEKTGVPAGEGSSTATGIAAAPVPLVGKLSGSISTSQILSAIPSAQASSVKPAPATDTLPPANNVTALPPATPALEAVGSANLAQADTGVLTGNTAERLMPIDGVETLSSDKSALTTPSPTAQALTGSSQASSEIIRQSTQAVLVNPESQKMIADAVNANMKASTLQRGTPESAGTGEASRFTEDLLPGQTTLLKMGNSLERNPVANGQLATALASSGPLDSGSSTTPAQALSQSDVGSIAARADQRMFAAENAQQAQSQAQQQTVARTAEGLPRYVMDTAFGQQGWPDNLGRQLMVMSSQGVSSAQIQLDPPELGSLMVKIQISADQQTSVSFVSQHALVRDTLEQQLSRLQDMFRDQGLNLQDVSVSDQAPQQQEGDARGQQGQGQGNGASEQESSAGEQVLQRSESLIDDYA
jgi:flagellar hook-length control protein FliK